MEDRETIEHNFKYSSDYRRCPETWKLTELEVLLDIRDLLSEMNGKLDVLRVLNYEIRK